MKGGSVSLKDLRPISILPVFLKVAESIFHSQLCDYVEKSEFLPSSQSGFRRGYSTASALCNTLDDITSARDAGNVTFLTLLDLSKAFDSVNLSRLIMKLQKYGLQDLRCMMGLNFRYSCRPYFIRKCLVTFTMSIHILGAKVGEEKLCKLQYIGYIS